MGCAQRGPGCRLHSGDGSTSVAFSADGTLLAAADPSGISFWNMATQTMEPLTIPIACRDFASKPPGKSVVAFCENGKVVVATEQRAQGPFQVTKKGDSLLAISPDG